MGWVYFLIGVRVILKVIFYKIVRMDSSNYTFMPSAFTFFIAGCYNTIMPSAFFFNPESRIVM
jgi:hypothetical protein